VGARASLTAAGLVVDTCAEEASGENGTAGGALHLSGADAIGHPEEVARRLVAAGADLTRLSVEEEDLESQFLRLVGAAPGGDEHAR
jgi:ABC-2 type transport system ATP-binding protein